MTLPYIDLPRRAFGNTPVQPFGLLVLVAMLTGGLVARARARTYGIPTVRFQSLALWCLGTGLVASHMLDVVFYRPATLRAAPLELFNLANGLSSFGGFIGATAAFFWSTRRERIDRWRCADAIAYSFPFGWFFGRLGCALTHDHPGRRSSSPLAVAAGPAWPDGPRFDLGLLELFCVPLLAIAVVLASRAADRARAAGGRPAWLARRGVVLAVLLALYAPLRFALDFLRATPAENGDARYVWLTPGQWGCLGLMSVALWLFARRDAPA